MSIDLLKKFTNKKAPELIIEFISSGSQDTDPCFHTYPVSVK